MSDIRCQTCAEPWEAHHLRYDAVHETSLPERTRRGWDGRLTPGIRRELEGQGYRFGSSVYSLKSCPSCPREARPTVAGRRRGMLADLAGDLFGDDLDGLRTEVSDLSN